MSVEWWGWALFCVAIAVFLLVDLLVLHRDAHAVSWKEAALTSTGWVALAVAFGGFVWWWQGSTAAGEYFAGYLIEKSLSVDNLFVIALIFTSFGVPAAYQHRVLFWGVVGAIVFRAIFIGVGSVLLHQFHWMIWVFGALLVVTGVRMALSDHAASHPQNSPVLHWMRKVLPIELDFHGPKFLVRHAGRWAATPLLAVLVVVEATDILFAVDSIPAIFAVTSDPFLVFTSNAFAILGLRALYFLLAGMMHRFVYLRYGLAAVLVFVGGKMIASEWVHLPVALSLAVIISLVGASVAASLLRTRGGMANEGGEVLPTAHH